MTNPSHDAPSTTVIHRKFGGLLGYRRVSDRATRAIVHAFPMSDLSQVAATGVLSTPGAYVLTDGQVGYFGESRKPARRLSEHAADPAKSFARDVYVIVGCEGGAFDKILSLDLQYRLTRRAVETGVVSVWKGAPPPAPDLSDAERVTHDRIAGDVVRLLHDAGCRIFHKETDPGSPAREEEPPQSATADAADSEPMAIGVTTIPAGSEEFELRYGGLFARGYWAAGRFIVSSGSEVRTTTNDSVCALTRSRRNELAAARVLAAIPGVGDRRRLTVAISFATSSIAAKVVTGAHTTGGWAPLNPSSAVYLA